MPDCIFEVKHYGQNVREYRYVNVAPDITSIDMIAIFASVIAIVFLFLPSLNYIGWLFLKILSAYGVLSLFFKLRTVKDESILVMRGLGIKLRKATFLGVQREEFIELGRIQDVVIHEGFKCWDVVFYIGIVVQGSKLLSVPFEHMHPNLSQLLTALGGIRALLFDEKEPINIHPASGVTFVQNFPYDAIDFSRLPRIFQDRILFVGSKCATDGIVPESKTSEHSAIITSVTLCDQALESLKVNLDSNGVKNMFANALPRAQTVSTHEN
eukprot:GDKJ01007065.1.p1 GENE.GDKJ01007065.1~~GDKJ01007065.1.p1  ORF type:complete len:269 (-),score=21.73 GDKJ01007065.1:38-844(-)